MSAGNVITARLIAGAPGVPSGELWQYDYGQIIRFTGVELPDTYEVHFGNSRFGQSKTQIGTADGCAIPDEFLLSGASLYVWVFLHTGEADGETEYSVTVPVLSRARPSDEEPTPEQQSAITEAIAALNSGVTRAESASAQAEAASAAVQDLDVEATTLTPGAPATVEKSVDPDTGAVSLTFGIPKGKTGNKGDPGDTGTTPDLQIGTVSTLPAGSQATAEISGTPENPLLDLGIPKGDPGEVTEAELDALGDEVADVKGRVDAVEAILPTKAGILRDTASGSIVSIVPDASVENLLGLSVAVEPVQSLNGYDNPWPAGGGVNKLGLTGRKIITQAEFANTTPRDFSEPSVYVGITPNNYFSYAQINSYSITEKSVTVNSKSGGYGVGFTVKCSPGTQYVFGYKNKALKYFGVSFYDTSGNFLSYVSVDQTSLWAFTTPENCENMIAVFRPNELNTDYLYDEPQLELGTTATPWTPYENICPISGRGSVVVNRTGKNLLPKMVAGTYTSSGITVVVDDTGAATVAISTGGTSEQLIVPLESGIVVTQAMVDGAYYHLNNTLVNPSVAPTLESAQNPGVIAPTTGTLNRIVSIPDTAVGKTINRIRFWAAANISASGTYAPSFEFNSTATAYEAYQGNQYTIQLGETVYGGTLDVVNGTMTVDRAMVDLGTLTWAYDSQNTRFFTTGLTGSIKRGTSGWLTDLVCSQYRTTSGITTDGSISEYASTGYVYVRDTRYTVASDFKTALSGVQLCYLLATPIELTLTPTEIATLQGTNNVWSDAGDVTVEYAADLKTYIDQKIAAAVAAMAGD